MEELASVATNMGVLMTRDHRDVILQASIRRARDDDSDAFQSAVETALLKDLPRVMDEIYGVQVAVDIKASRYGSIFYRVVVTAGHKNGSASL